MPIRRLLLSAFAPRRWEKAAHREGLGERDVSYKSAAPIAPLRSANAPASSPRPLAGEGVGERAGQPRYRLMALLSVIFCGFSSLALADSHPAAALSELLSKAQTLSGRFTQLTLSASGTRLQEVKGQMALQRPGMFHWHTDAPLEQLLVCNGQTVWLYDPDLEQVTVQKLDERLSHTPALLLSGDVSKISENFEVSQEQGDDVLRFTLKPNSSDSLFDSLRLAFRQGLISEMQLIDNSGQSTSIHFFGVQMNGTLLGTTFEFDIPPGTDVIQE